MTVWLWTSSSWPCVIDCGQWHMAISEPWKSVIDRGQWQKKVSLTGCILSLYKKEWSVYMKWNLIPKKRVYGVNDKFAISELIVTVMILPTQETGSVTSMQRSVVTSRLDWQLTIYVRGDCGEICTAYTAYSDNSMCLASQKLLEKKR